MCDYSGINMVFYGAKAGKYIRCPGCNRRVKPRMRDAHYNIIGTSDVFYVLPPHKIKKWWKRKEK